MQKFKIKVNGEVYEVEVEQIGGAPAAAPAAPPPAPVAAPAPAPAPAAAPAAARNRPRRQLQNQLVVAAAVEHYVLRCLVQYWKSRSTWAML